MLRRYNPQKLRQGYNNVNGEDVFFIANPGLGLWAYREKLLRDAACQTNGAENQ
jgi:hypothetical protein